MGWDPLHCWVVLPSCPPHPGREAAALKEHQLLKLSSTTEWGSAGWICSPPRAIPVTTALPGHPGWDTQDPGAGGAGGAGTSLPSWPLIPDLAFSAADTEHFLTGHVRTSRKRDLSINPCSNSSEHWRQPQIPFWNKVPQNKRVLSSETAENAWF